ncbi:MAG: CDK5 domain-containing protein [Cyanobacteriota bacterium]
MIFLPKSQPAPISLEKEKKKVSGKYNLNDVLERLNTDFKNKCYICETKEPTSINVEHFKPHKENIDLKFDWNNLFFCCGHCNNTKLAKPEFDNILNCTESNNVEIKIKYHINPYPKEKANFLALENKDEINNTVKLLDQVYNGTTVLKLLESSNMRNNLLKEIIEFQNFLIKYADEEEFEEKEKFKKAIIKHLKPSSSFTAFKRWIIRNNDFFNNKFAEYTI